jgi:threonine dehydrogenase-like Zn-dependent dehydrogenase
MLAGGICGSDLPYFKGAGHPGASVPGTPLGVGKPMHEMVGTVLASGDDRFQIGDTVVGWASDANGLAQVVDTDANQIITYDATHFAPEHAIAIQPLACVIYAVDQLPDVTGKTVAIIGLGPIGLLFAHVLRNGGAGHIIGVDVVDRAEDAPAYGVDEVEHASSSRWAASITPQDAPDIVIEAAGHQSGTLNDAVRAVKNEGTIYYFGIPDEDSYVFKMESFLRKNLTLTSGLTLERSHSLAAGRDYLENKPELAKRYITDVLPAATEADAAYHLAIRPRTGQAKIVVTFD